MAVARIESLAHGPHGVARIDGKVHFVRQAAPGDEVEVEVDEDHPTFAYARVARVLAPGPVRREAPCPYLPRCGGCPWQHVAYDAQAAAKEASVRDLLSRMGGIDPSVVRPIVRAASEYGYRRRLSLRVADSEVGFLAAASHDLVPVEHCLLGHERLEGAIPLARALVRALGTRVNRVEIVATGDDHRVAVVAQADGEMAAADAEVGEALLRREPRIAALVLRGKRFRRVWGDDRVRVPLVDGDEMWLRAGDFSQVSDHGNAELIRLVLEHASVAKHHRVADLYAGAGNLSLPLARRAGAVLAVERTPTSVEAARENVRRLGIDNVELAIGPTETVLRGWTRRGLRVDTVVLDPPRSGAAEALSSLLALAAARIVYVSCNPATLARDLKTLARAYRVELVQPIDIFPQTYHVEAVALLTRKDPRATALG
ncbi:MAG: 23S rRNA (uracil(1939)-C(5))-methyltransferase RlmD [Deltaproteobacteria bacterium]|nr:23S rRNA (uracil(1939)-C(5))-methyltransferase RlmD [Deltaproteobacteria bacterium]